MTPKERIAIIGILSFIYLIYMVSYDLQYSSIDNSLSTGKRLRLFPKQIPTERKLSICPNPDEFPKPITIEGCASSIVDETFEGTGNVWKGHLDALGVLEELLPHDSSSLLNKQYLKVSKRDKSWQGPILPLSLSLTECIVPDSPYFFRVSIRLTKEDTPVSSDCYTSGTNCPQLQYNFKNKKGEPGSLTLATLTNPVQDGSWTTWSSIIVFPKKYLKRTDSASITVNGPEAGVDISIDEIKIYQPPSGHYPNPDAVCDQLVVNGDNSQSELFTYPIYSFDSAESLKIEQDANGNYMTMDSRGAVTSGPKVQLIPGCLRDGAKYKFTSKIRMYEEQSIGSRVVLRYNDATTGEYAFETLAQCSESSKSIGWVDCNGELAVSADKQRPPYFISWITDDGSTGKTDWRDVSLKPIACSSSSQDSGDCLRGVTVHIDPEANPDIELVVTNMKDSSKKFQYSSTFLDNQSDSKNTHLGRAMRSFSFVLPGGSWMGHFYLDGQMTWPTFAEIILGDPPSCPGSLDSIIIKPPSIDRGDTCDNLITNGDFESSIATTQWYHNGAGLKFIIISAENGNKALSTVRRTTTGHGLYHILDTGCLVLGKTYNIVGKVRMISNDGTIPTCNPGAALDGCPVAKIRAFEHGIRISEKVVGRTLVPFLPGNWNMLHGSFTVNHKFESADKVVFLVEGVRKGVEIALDDIKIVPSTESQNLNCVRNGDFEVGDARNWECVGNPETCSLKMVEMTDGESKFALSTGNRQANWWGLAQKLDLNCFTLPGKYEVNADVKVIDSTTKQEMTCDPYQYFHGLPNFCPTILLAAQDPVNSKIKIPAGSTVGPYQANSWNKIYGIVDITNEMMTWYKMYAYIGLSAPNVEIVVDNISLTPANDLTEGITNCRQLVKNGDAEVGDARFWFINGVEDFGTVTIVDDSPNGSGDYAFYHTGDRQKVKHGMWQEINKACITAESRWKITAYFKLFDSNDSPVTCDKSQPVGGPNSCPLFRISTYYGNGEDEFQKNLMNEDMTPWDVSGWNYYENTVTMDFNLYSRERIFVFVYGVLPGYRYMVDNIAMTRT